MKYSIIILCLFALGSRSLAQREIDWELETAIYPITLSHEFQRNATDTAYYPTFGDECARDAITLGIEQAWGRISGMNAFGDLEKAQRLEFTTTTSYRVIGALVYFETPAIVGDGLVNCKIYSVSTQTSGPGNLLGFSNGIKLSDITPPDSMPRATAFSFEDGINVDLEESRFFLSVDFSSLYSTFDTLVLLQTITECGDGGNTWEQWVDGTWVPINSLDSWQVNSDFMMSAIVEFDETTSNRDYISNQGIKLYPPFPNPARDRVTLSFSLDNSSPVILRIFDQKGGLIESIDLGLQNSGRNNYTLPTQHLASGYYIYQIKGNSGSISSRFYKTN